MSLIARVFYGFIAAALFDAVLAALAAAGLFALTHSWYCAYGLGVVANAELVMVFGFLPSLGYGLSMMRRVSTTPGPNPASLIRYSLAVSGALAITVLVIILMANVSNSFEFRYAVALLLLFLADGAVVGWLMGAYFRRYTITKD